MKDVYHRVDEFLMIRRFYDKTTEEKKELVEEGLKDYVLSKIQERDAKRGGILLNKKDDISLDDLVAILGELIPKEEHFDTLRHLTHYILNIAGEMQYFTIVWLDEKDPSLIENPEISFNADGKWDKLTSHKETSYVQTFHFVHQVFKDEFKKNKTGSKKLINVNKNNRLTDGNN